MFGKKVKTENGLYGIIGLGRFGYALAQDSLGIRKRFDYH